MLLFIAIALTLDGCKHLEFNIKTSFNSNMNTVILQELHLRFRQSPGGPDTEAIRRGREESKSHPLEVLGVIFPWNPLATLSFHEGNSAIAEGLVLLRDGI